MGEHQRRTQVKEVLRDAAVVDFEGFQSRDGTGRAAVPVGVGTWLPAGKPTYRAFAHPTGGNTHTWAQARQHLGELYASGRPLLFHGSKYDVKVAHEHLDLPVPPWHQCHDTQPMLFLDDPRAETFKLKPSAERLLGEPPAERAAVERWLLEHQPLRSCGVVMSQSLDSDTYVGKYVAWAPAHLVGKYNLGDLTRTRGLAKKLLPKLEERQMLEAYDRERRLLPLVLEMEGQGMRVDLARLERDVPRYYRVLAQVDAWLRKRLRTKDLNVNSPAQLGEALMRARVARLPKTDSGQWETNKETLLEHVTNPLVLAVLIYRAKLKTALTTFLEPWLVQARLTGGIIFTTWNTVRTDRGKGLAGARTGRLSSTPNFQNLMKPLDLVTFFEDLSLPYPNELPPLPNVRSYVVPWDAGELFFDRDYSQQELRILAHFEDGGLLEAYQANPWLDLHDKARTDINEMLQANWPRKPVKNTVLGLIYGEGVGLLAKKSRITVDLAKQLKQALLTLFPGLRELYRDMKRRAQQGEPIRTWGGREYFCEPPKLVDGNLRHFDYKLLNVLIQGSAADQTKEAMVRFFEAKPRDVRVYLTAHDEVLASCPRAKLHERMELLRQVMESVNCDVPMLTEGAWSDADWGHLKDYDKKGKVLKVDFRRLAERARAQVRLAA